LPIKELRGGRGDLGTHQSSGKFPRIGSGQCLKQHLFYWRIFANFDLKNMISMDARDFSWKKWLKFVIFQRIVFPNRQILMISSSMYPRNIERFCFFPTFVSSIHPNLAKLLCQRLPPSASQNP
jgi:hypothetical protein